ncbi:hypothetical protein ACHAWF_018433 [Thalassiosira exigua]
MMLYIQSVLWDLDIPQEAATLLYENNHACTALGNAHKPTTCTCHMDIKYFFFCKWMECDMLKLQGVNTLINLSDHFTKSLTRHLFHCHADYIAGKYPSCICLLPRQGTTRQNPPLWEPTDTYTTHYCFTPRHNPLQQLWLMYVALFVEVTKTFGIGPFGLVSSRL